MNVKIMITYTNIIKTCDLCMLEGLQRIIICLYNNGTSHNYSIALIISIMRNHTSLRAIGI